MGAELGLLAVAVGSLAVGPLLAWAWPGGRAWRAFLDGLSLSLVGGLCLLHLAPHAVAEGGLPALAAGALGFLGPALLHRASGAGARLWAVGGALAVLVHSAIDGAALAVAGESGRAVAIAVAAHQVPVGLGIWALAHRADARRAAVVGWGALAAAMAATGVGYVTGEQVIAALPSLAESALEALVAGALLHVVFDAAGEHDHAHDAPAPARPTRALVLAPAGEAHRFVRVVGPPRPVAVAHGHRHCQAHAHDHGHDTAALRAWSSVGAVLGAAVIGALSSGGGAVDHLSDTARVFASLVTAGAPALLAGYAVAGVVAAVAAPEAPRAARSAVGQALAGVGFGLPLPVCACGVLPMYESLVRRGVPAITALGFLLATPSLGPEALLLGVPLLGVPFTLARAVGVLGSAAAVAVLVGHTLPTGVPSARAEAPEPAPPLAERLRDGLRFAFVDLVDHTLPWVVLGLLVSALAEPLLGHDLLRAVPPVLAVPALAALALPFHVCAAGAAPLAAIAVHKGVSAGAALAFVLAGPATGFGTYATLARLHGARVAVRYAVAVAGLAVLAGWAVDLLAIPVAPVAHASPAPGPVGLAATAVLAALGTASLFRQGARGVVGQILAPTHSHRATGR